MPYTPQWMFPNSVASMRGMPMSDTAVRGSTVVAVHRSIDWRMSRRAPPIRTIAPMRPNSSNGSHPSMRRLPRKRSGSTAAPDCSASARRVASEMRLTCPCSLSNIPCTV